MSVNAVTRPEYVSLQDAAVIYGVSVDLLRERITSGELPAVHSGRRLIRVRLVWLFVLPVGVSATRPSAG